MKRKVLSYSKRTLMAVMLIALIINCVNVAPATRAKEINVNPLSDKKIKEICMNEWRGYGAITEEGDLYIWGTVYDYRPNNYVFYTYPQKVLENVIDVQCNGSIWGAITSNQDLYIWGGKYTGDGSDAIYSTPKKLMSNIKKFYTKDGTSCAIDVNDNLYMWGDNYTAIIDESREDVYEPILKLTNIDYVCINRGTIGAVTTSKKLYMWGYNDFGGVGDGTRTKYVTEPKLIMEDVVDFRTEGNTSCAVTVDGDLYVWGAQFDGGLRGGINCDSTEPILKASGVKSAMTYSYHVLYVTENGELYDSNGSKTFLPELAMSDVKYYYMGMGKSYVITNDDEFYLWKGGMIDSLSPIVIFNNTKEVRVDEDTSSSAVMLLTNDGDLYLWNCDVFGERREEPFKVNVEYYDDEQADEDPDDYPEAETVGTMGKLYQKESGLGEIELFCDETVFAENTTTYHHKLAVFAAGMATMIYNEKEDANGNNNRNMENALSHLGYINIKEVEDKDEDKAPYCLAYKTVMLEGKKTNILCVIIRGTYNEEWIDNFDSGYGESIHKGFLRGADFVYDGICDYVKENELSDGKLKILITGHSRGAAVANLLGAGIDDNSLAKSDNSLSISNKDAFVYTFATPNTTSVQGRDNEIYNNIFNIVNPEDFVTKVMPSKWGYGRYGRSYVLPSKSTDLYTDNTDNYVNYKSYLEKLQGYYKKYRPDDKDGYRPYIKGMVDVSEYVTTITNSVPNSQKYYTKNLHNNTDDGDINTPHSLKCLFTKTLGYYMSNNDFYKTASYVNIAVASTGLYWGEIGQKTVSFFLVHQALGMLPILTESFACAHRSETYLAAMNSLSEEQLRQGRSTMKGIVNCPVDITIKNADGDVLGQIENNEINETLNDDITMNVDGDSKSFYLPVGQDFTVELTGNDEGKMDYSLCEIDADTGETKRVSYQAVDVEQNKTLTQQINADSGLEQIKLSTDDNQEIKPTLVYEADDYGVDIDVIVEGVGTVDGHSNVRLGDYIRLEAVTDDNNDFIGYYDEDGTLLSEQTDFAFSVQGNRTLIARFTNNIIDVESVTFENSSVEMKVGDENMLTAIVNPSNATNKWLTYSSTNDDIVKVNDCGIIFAVSEGEAIITAVTEDGKHEAAMNVTVKRSNENNQNQTDTKITKPSKVTNVKLKNKKGKKILVSWKQKSDVSGYQIQYALNKKFAKKKSVNVSKNKSSKIITGLKKKKTYYVRIRGYKSQKGKKYYGKWSSVKKIKIKK